MLGENLRHEVLKVLSLPTSISKFLFDNTGSPKFLPNDRFTKL